MAERVSLGADVDISEQRERFYVAILVESVVGHVNIACRNGWSSPLGYVSRHQ